MIIAGDIASPSAMHSAQLEDIFLSYPEIFEGKNFICNLEGLIDDGQLLQENKPVLFNHSSVIEALLHANTKAVGLANNHTLDIPDRFTSTANLLEKNNILWVGVQNQNPIFFEDDTHKIILFNYCWDFLLYHQDNPAKNVSVDLIDEETLIVKVRESTRNYPHAKIIIFMHWSFDQETLPFPMYRQFSKALIDEGALAIVGCHSHCIQGGETYKNGYIVYGLGNFFLPWNTFANGKLSFPEFSRSQLVFELDITTNEAYCHFFNYMNNEDSHYLNHVESVPFVESALLEKYSPFIGLSDKQYIQYYKKHRRKRLLIPTYTDYKNKTVNKLYTTFLKGRGRLARFLAERNLRKWQN